MRAARALQFPHRQSDSVSGRLPWAAPLSIRTCRQTGYSPQVAALASTRIANTASPRFQPGCEKKLLHGDMPCNQTRTTREINTVTSSRRRPEVSLAQHVVTNRSLADGSYGTRGSSRETFMSIRHEAIKSTRTGNSLGGLPVTFCPVVGFR